MCPEADEVRGDGLRLRVRASIGLFSHSLIADINDVRAWPLGPAVTVRILRGIGGGITGEDRGPLPREDEASDGGEDDEKADDRPERLMEGDGAGDVDCDNLSESEPRDEAVSL